jgi:ribonuclease HII
MENFSLHTPPDGPDKGRSKKKILKDSFEHAAWQVQQLVCGVDEVGRGCLAGPLVAAAVILHPGKKSRLVKDSKLLTKPELIKGNEWVLANSWYGYGIISPQEIDLHNIYQANLIVMKRAVMQALAMCPFKPSAILVDAMPLKLSFSAYQDLAIHHFPKGESWSSSIAAASIIAKVKRDTLITKFDPLFPGYKLSEHKGYSAKVHCQAVRELGRTIIHRESFLDKVMSYQEHKDEQQQSIC